MLEVQLLEAGAKAPIVAHAGEDLGYDLFALEDTVLPYGEVVTVRTGIAVAAYRARMVNVWAGEVGHGAPRATYAASKTPLGLQIRDRSSMALKGIVTSGGIIDSGYRGEIKVLMTYTKRITSSEQVYTAVAPFVYDTSYMIQAGDKIAQMVPVEVLTGEVYVVGELQKAVRGDSGFGSTGK